MTAQRRIAIIGAGISGLAAAYALQEEARGKSFPTRIDLFEKSGRVGGVINTERKDGFLFEWGPENFVPFKPEAVKLARELGLGDELIGSNDERRQTYVVSNGRIHPLPDGMAFLAPVRVRPFWASPLLSRTGKLRAMLEPLIPASHGDLTVRAFLERRLGRELTRKVAEPLVSAIYGGDINQLSIASALPDTHRIEQKYGSLWNGLRKGKRRGGPKQPFFMSLRSGMETLVHRLAAALPEVQVRTGTRSLALTRLSGGFRLAGRETDESYDSVLICAPAAASSDLLRSIAPEASAELDSIQYTSTSLIYLAYKRSEFSHPLNGFGFVTPEGESEVLDACTWVSTKFEGRCPPDHVLLRCAVHDGRRARIFPSDEEVAEKAHDEMRRLLHVSCSPAFYRVTHLGKSMPQMTVGHAEKLKRMTTALAVHPGLFLTGPFYNGVGVPDCIRSARQTVERMTAFLQNPQ